MQGELRYAYETLSEETENKRSVWRHAWRKMLHLMFIGPCVIVIVEE